MKNHHNGRSKQQPLPHQIGFWPLLVYVCSCLLIWTDNFVLGEQIPAAFLSPKSLRPRSCSYGIHHARASIPSIQQMHQEKRLFPLASTMTKSKDICVDRSSSTLSQSSSDDSDDAAAKSSPREPLVDNFHEDMRRILKTRRDMFRHEKQQHKDEEGGDQTSDEADWIGSYAPFSPWFRHSKNGNENDQDLPTTSDPPLILEVDRRHRPPLISHDFDGADRVHQMLQVLRRKHLATETSYEIVMQAYLQRGRLRWIAQDFETQNNDNDDEEEDEREDSDRHEVTLDVLYTASSDDRNDDIDDDAEAIDEEMDEDESQSMQSTPDPRRASRSGPSVVCAADIVHNLWKQRSRDQKSCKSDTSIVWNTASASWLASQASCSTPRGDRSYASRAMTFLQSLRSQQVQENGVSHMPIEALVHGINAAAWQQGNLQKGYWAQQADDLFQELVEKCNYLIKSGGHAEVSLLAYHNQSYTAQDVRMQAAAWTLEAWSKSNSPGSSARAQAILEQMIEWKNAYSANNQQDLYLDAEVYSNAILACAKDGDADRAQSLLLDMISVYRAGGFPSHGAEPPLIAFNGVISAWSKKQETENAVKVLKLLQRVQAECKTLVPDAVAYNSVLFSFVNSRSDSETVVQYASSLVRYMEENQEKQPAIRPTAFTYHTYLKCLLNKCNRRVNRSSSHDNNAETLQLLDETLSRVERMWKAGDRSVDPNNRIFNMVINAYAKSHDRSAARKAFDLLDRMNQSDLYKPDIITMTSVMECLSKSSSPHACQQALGLLRDVSAQYDATKLPDLMPNVRIFSMAILTLSHNQGSVEDARNLLTELVDLYEETKHEDLRPNAYPYNYVLNCAANSLSKDMKAQHFRVATQTYKEMRKSPYVQPDSFTYGFWLKCCNNLLDDMELRAKCVAYAFEECKQHGLLTNEVLTRLYQGSKPDLVDQVLELEDHDHKNGPYRTSLRVADLPPAWSRNSSRKHKQNLRR
mmetsp:Transcript_37111/g.77114  ORF Transcript_37111/g.77114 Transcript_37111/m.77114 type:complete len:979 (-) Transcript_37111:210-3146(-)